MKLFNQIILTGLFSVLYFAMAAMGLSNWPWRQSPDSLLALQTGQNTVTQKSSSEMVALDYLKKARQLHSVRVGFDGRVSESYNMFKQIQKSPNASELFMELVNSDREMAQVYGLIGLYGTDRFRYDELLPVFKRSRIEVGILSGCSASTIQVSAINFSQYAQTFQKRMGG